MKKYKNVTLAKNYQGVWGVLFEDPEDGLCVADEETFYDASWGEPWEKAEPGEDTPEGILEVLENLKEEEEVESELECCGCHKRHVKILSDRQIEGAYCVECSMKAFGKEENYQSWLKSREK